MLLYVLTRSCCLLCYMFCSVMMYKYIDSRRYHFAVSTIAAVPHASYQIPPHFIHSESLRSRENRESKEDPSSMPRYGSFAFSSFFHFIIFFEVLGCGFEFDGANFFLKIFISSFKQRYFHNITPSFHVQLILEGWAISITESFLLDWRSRKARRNWQSLFVCYSSPFRHLIALSHLYWLI